MDTFTSENKIYSQSIIKDTMLADGVRYVEMKPQGVCSQLIQISTRNDVVQQIQYTKSCSGNSQGIAALAKGMKINDVIARVEGIRCGEKCTSCPDQLAKALTYIRDN